MWGMDFGSLFCKAIVKIILFYILYIFLLLDIRREENTKHKGRKKNRNIIEGHFAVTITKQTQNYKLFSFFADLM